MPLTFSERIKIRVMQQELRSIQGAAEAAGVHQATVYRALDDWPAATEKTRASVAAALGLTEGTLDRWWTDAIAESN